MESELTRFAREFDRNRFFDRVSPEPMSGCWLWLGPINRQGYGMFSYWVKEQRNKHFRTHRLSYEMFIGQIPKGAHVLHKCDVPCCVNPNHLWIGNQKKNMKDMSNKKRSYNQRKTHCKHGHPFDKKNTYYRKGGPWRLCRECNKINSRKSYYLKKARAQMEIAA